MPPPGVRRPDQARGGQPGVVARARRSTRRPRRNPNPGRVALHRLNRAEYANAIEDLLGLRIDASGAPAQGRRGRRVRQRGQRAEGVAVVPRSVHLGGARREHASASATRSREPASATYRPARGIDQGAHVEGLPLGTRGGLLVEHLFPADGEYKLNIGGLAIAGYVRGMEYQHTLDRHDRWRQGVRGADRRRGGHEGHRPAAGPGGRRDQRPFPEHPGQGDGGPAQGRRHVHRPDVRGIRRSAVSRSGRASARNGFRESGAWRSWARSIRPASARRRAGSGSSCAARATPARSSRARRRFCRRSRGARSVVRSRSSDLEAPLALLPQRRGRPAISRRPSGTALTDDSGQPEVPVSAPSGSPAGVAPGSIYRISDLDLASRLAFFLPGRMPDDELLDVAEKGRLADAEGARGAGPAAAGRPAHRSRWSPASRSSGCKVRGARQHRSGRRPLSQLRRRPARRVPQGDGAVRRQHPARGSQRARSADARTTPS